MKTDLLSSPDLEMMFQEIRARLGLTTEGLRICKGVSHAMTEVTRSLIHLFGHKKSFAVLKGATPFFEPLLPQLAREGMFKQELLIDQLRSAPAELETWVKGLKPDTLFVLLCEDDPLTGETFAVEELENFLQAKKIFSIRLSHSKFLFGKNQKPTASHTCRIVSVSPTAAVVILGPRVKVDPLIAGDLVWNRKEDSNLLLGLKPRVESRDKVLRFEAGRFANSQAFFDLQTPRIHDRAVLVWEDMDAAAIAELLSEKMGWDFKDESGDPQVETSSPCRWGLEARTHWLAERGIPLEQIRGLLVLDAQCLNPELEQAINDCRQEIFKMQNG